MMRMWECIPLPAQCSDEFKQHNLGTLAIMAQLRYATKMNYRHKHTSYI